MYECAMTNGICNVGNVGQMNYHKKFVDDFAMHLTQSTQSNGIFAGMHEPAAQSNMRPLTSDILYNSSLSIFHRQHNRKPTCSYNFTSTVNQPAL